MLWKEEISLSKWCPGGYLMPACWLMWECGLAAAQGEGTLHSTPAISALDCSQTWTSSLAVYQLMGIYKHPLYDIYVWYIYINIFVKNDKGKCLELIFRWGEDHRWHPEKLGRSKIYQKSVLHHEVRDSEFSANQGMFSNTIIQLLTIQNLFWQ